MPKIERTIWLRPPGEIYSDPFHTFEASDDKAKRKAIHELENRLGKIRGSLTKHYKNNPDDITVVMK